jgi:hypothetical protein
MGKGMNAGRIWLGRRERDHLEDTGVDGRIISKWILYIKGGRGLEWSGSRQSHVAGSEYVTEPWGSKKYWEFLE